MHELFIYEHGKPITYPGDISELEALLETIWNQRSREDTLDFWREKKQGGQPFLKIGAQGQLKARNYVGFIRGSEYTLHLLPKLYEDLGSDTPSAEKLDQIYLNLLWWLSYTPTLQVPQYLSGLDHTQGDPLEIFMGLFATLTRKVLSQSVFQSYETHNDELAVVRGRLDMKEYIRHCLSTARWHRVRCSYESFELDNLLNRLIKRVTRLLLSVTRRALTRQKLEDILYFLDEVSDEPVQAQDCDRVQLNPMFEDYRPILDYCRLFLQNSVSYAYKPELKVFALLIPMERIFEYFLAGFLDTHKSKIQGLSRVAFQKSNLYLAEEVFANERSRPAFRMYHDLMLTYFGQEIILDAKYKRLSAEKSYHGVSQADMYQMVSYGMRRDVRHCGLIYPQIPGEKEPVSKHFQVSPANGSAPIQIRAAQIPFVSESTDNDFKKSEEVLLLAFENLLKPFISVPAIF